MAVLFLISGEELVFSYHDANNDDQVWFCYSKLWRVLVGNGDVLSYEDALLRREQTGVAGLMVARFCIWGQITAMTTTTTTMPKMTMTTAMKLTATITTTAKFICFFFVCFFFGGGGGVLKTNVWELSGNGVSSCAIRKRNHRSSGKKLPYKLRSRGGEGGEIKAPSSPLF